MAYKRKLEFGKSLMHSLPLLRVDVLVIWSKKTLLHSQLLPANGTDKSQEEAKTVEKSAKRISSRFSICPGGQSCCCLLQAARVQHPAPGWVPALPFPCTFPFHRPLTVMSTEACTDAFTFLLFCLGITVSSSPLLQLLRHAALLPTL